MSDFVEEWLDGSRADETLEEFFERREAEEEDAYWIKAGEIAAAVPGSPGFLERQRQAIIAARSERRYEAPEFTLDMFGDPSRW